MEPLVIDRAKEEAKMGRIVRNIHVYCYQFYFLSRLYNNFFKARSIVLKECYLMMNFEKSYFAVFKRSVKMQI